MCNQFKFVLCNVSMLFFIVMITISHHFIGLLVVVPVILVKPDRIYCFHF